MSALATVEAQFDAYNAQDLDAYCGYFTDDVIVADYNGAVYDFRYAVTDPQGNLDTALATFTVTPVNDPPVAYPDQDFTQQGVAVTLVDLPGANDFDSDGAVSDGFKPRDGAIVGASDGAPVKEGPASWIGATTEAGKAEKRATVPAKADGANSNIRTAFFIEAPCY